MGVEVYTSVDVNVNVKVHVEEGIDAETSPEKTYILTNIFCFIVL